MPILRRRCPIDGLEFDLLSVRGELSALDHPDVDHLGCPTCGAEGYAIVASFLPKDLGGEAGVGKLYPYYDHGLGTHVRDVGHHRWLMEHEPNGQKREARLRQTHGDVEFEADCDKRKSEMEASEARYRAQQDELINGPNKAHYGKLCDILREKGAIERLWGNDADDGRGR